MRLLYGLVAILSIFGVIGTLNPAFLIPAVIGLIGIYTTDDTPDF